MIGLTLIIIGIVCFVAIPIANPTETPAQLLINHWVLYLCGLMLVGMGWWMGREDE